MSKNKKDLELKQQIKAMEDQKRKENMAVEVAVSSETAKISFDQWWVIINTKVQMKPYMKEILLADFASRGLTKLEEEQKYNDTLRIFGIKW
jgi:hypothetical protein